MTTYQGVAVVTQCIKYLVESSLRAAVPEALVTTDPPEQPAAAARDAARVNIYLVQVVPDATQRNADLPTRSPSGQLVATPKAAIDLRYLLSFFGNPPQSHLMLGAVEVALREQAYVSAALIAAATADHPELQASGLEQQAPVRLAPQAISLDELSRFWSGFVQSPYTLSVLYEASTVVLASGSSTAATLPVATAGVASSGMPPRVVEVSTVDYAPGATVTITGSRLDAASHVLVGGTWVPLRSETPGRAIFALPTGSRAGAQPIVLGALRNGAPMPMAGASSSVLVVRPVVTRSKWSTADSTLSVRVAPDIRPDQVCTLSLVAIPIDDGAPVPDDLPSAQQALPPGTVGDSVQVRLPKLPPGRYVASISVGGTTSIPVQVDGRYEEPSVMVR